MNNSAYATEEGLAATLLEATRDAEFPQYGYGVVQAAALAGALGHRRMTAVELGVAGGNGLVALERLSRIHSSPSGVGIRVAGVDLAAGMPKPIDYRDLPYIWQESFFKMDEPLLRARLQEAELYIVDVRESAPYILSKEAPLGFISFDLDYYSSTKAALDALLRGNHEYYLPRVVCYFDDTVGPHHEMHSVFAGELLAIEEFNKETASRKLGKLNGLRYKVGPNDGPWVDGIHILHILDHPDYSKYIYPSPDRQFPLTS